MERSLIVEIEKRANRMMSTHRYFVWLSEQMLKATAEYVSPTTLKRVWGHQCDYCHPSRYTLNLLSRFLGYADYSNFMTDTPTDIETSSLKTPCFMTTNLSLNDELCLSWSPDRSIIVRFTGSDDRFEVVAAQNSKLCAGDTFTCQAFIEGEVCCLNNVFHNSAGPFVCLIGKQGGISISPR